jgi:hypothetical protein
MTRDPRERGRQVAALFLRAAPGLFRDVEESGLLPPLDEVGRERARREWECFALYACVRGLVAIGGFTPDAGEAIDAFHQAVLEQLMRSSASLEEFEARRALIAQRYQEYGELGQRESRGGEPGVARQLGMAAAHRMVGPAEFSEALGEVVGSLHEALVDGVLELAQGGT